MAAFYQSFGSRWRRRRGRRCAIAPDVAQCATQALPPRFAQAEAFGAPAEIRIGRGGAATRCRDGLRGLAALPHAQRKR